VDSRVGRRTLGGRGHDTARLVRGRGAACPGVAPARCRVELPTP
jgi:hypothetical protein